MKVDSTIIQFYLIGMLVTGLGFIDKVKGRFLLMFSLVILPGAYSRHSLLVMKRIWRDESAKH